MRSSGASVLGAMFSTGGTSVASMSKAKRKKQRVKRAVWLLDLYRLKHPEAFE